MDKNSPTRAMLSVSEVTNRARNLLEYELSSLWVVGEIASISRPASGHWYFSLKDDKAQIRCVMFRQQNIMAKPPAQGDSVLVCGRVSLYEARGEFQMIASILEHRGAGALHMRFEKLKQQLQDEGLFAPENKRSLPQFPKNIGVVTSATGAALQDMRSVFERHSSPVSVSLYPCIVQGESAAQSIRQALALANKQHLAEILIVGRGGGSYEDLFCFNDELLARDIRNSEIPIISAVGHEVDFTIADFVADLRAPTPTAAMELALRSLSELPVKIETERRHLSSAVQNLIGQRSDRVKALRRRLRSPLILVDQQRQSFDRLLNQFHRVLRHTTQRNQARLSELSQRLHANAPSRQLTQLQSSLESLRASLDRQIRQYLRTAQMELARRVGILETVSPLSTVQRGYAIIFDSQNQVVRSVDQVTLGDEISAKVRDGTLELTLSGKQKDK